VRTVILTTKKVLFLCLKNQEVAAVLLHDCTCAVTSLVHDPLLEMTSEFVLMFFYGRIRSHVVVTDTV
jgi:hypothetical protein